MDVGATAPIEKHWAGTVGRDSSKTEQAIKKVGTPTDRCAKRAKPRRRVQPAERGKGRRSNPTNYNYENRSALT